MMRILTLFILAFCCMIQQATAQARPAYNQYILNPFILNPALAGVENYTDVKISRRLQWQRIPGAPVTSYITLQTPIQKSDYRPSPVGYGVPGSNPRGEEYWRNYQAPDPHHGAGLQVVSDQAGYINRWSATANYAYHLPLSTRASLAAGISAGISSYNLTRSEIVWASLDPNDPAVGLSSGELKKIVPEVGAGLFLYHPQYFAGISVLNIVPGSKYRYTAAQRYGMNYTPNFFLSAGFRGTVTDDITIMPSFMLQYWQPQLYGLHANLKFQYRDLLWLGGSYRHANILGGYSVMAGMYISHLFNVSYSYEVASTKVMRQYAGNTHEFLLGFTIGNAYDNSCPKNVW